MKKELDFTVECGNKERLDVYLARLIPDSSRSYLQKLIKDGRVSVDNNVVTLPRQQLKNGSHLHIILPELPDTAPSAEPFDFEIVFEDASMLVINKPAGVVVHPAPGSPDGTVVNALLGRYPQFAESFTENDASRPGIVHRLDKDTSGCLIIAKTPEAQFKLGKAFAEHLTTKSYLAISAGIPKHTRGELKTLIGRHPVNRQKMAIVERNGKEAVTAYELIGKNLVENTPLSLLKVNIATGRTHQIRVHLSSLKLPIVGDTVYNRRPAFPGVTRQMLHAYQLSIPHPESGELLTFTAPIPDDFRALAQKITDITDNF